MRAAEQILIMGSPKGSAAKLLLDSITATPTSAYSTRLLRAAYAGKAIRVRRSSDNTEQDIGFVNGLLDTASLLAFCGAGNGFLSKWYAQIGTLDMVQATAAQQPRIVASGSLLTLNGRPAPTFSSSSSTVMASSASSNFISAAVYTLIHSARPAVAGTGDANGYGQPGVLGDTAGYLWHAYGATKGILGHFSTVTKEAIGPTISYPSTHVGVSQLNGGTLKGWFDGGANLSVAGATNIGNTGSAMQLGRSNAYLTGINMEAFTFSTAISLADINILGASLAAYAGSAWTPAT